MACKVSFRCYTSFVRHYGYTSGVAMPNYDFKPKLYSGPSFEKTEQIKSRHMPQSIYNIYKKPLLLNQGHMQWLYDHEGRRYLDLAAGIVTISVGHCHPKLVSALKEQTDIVWHTTNIYRHPKIYEYVEQLASKLPGDLKVVYLVNSGSEANDLAVLLAKLYTGNNDIISLQHSYHGCSSGLLGLTATKSYRLPVPTPSGFYHILSVYAPKNSSSWSFDGNMEGAVLSSLKLVHNGLILCKLGGSLCKKTISPDPYHGPWGGCRDSLSQPLGHTCNCSNECEATNKYIEQLDNVLNNSVSGGRVAAMFAEPIQGVGGAVQYTKGYIKKAQALIKKNGGLFVADEVQTGFGRTGSHYWGFESHDIIPDIVTMAKGIGNGFPMGAVVTTKEIAAAHKASYFNTFGGNPLACAVGNAVLEVIDEEKLQKNCKETGDYFIKQLMDLQNVHPVIGDVRGKGLMIGCEFVKPGTKEPLQVEVLAEIHETMKDLGVLTARGGRWGNVMRLKPPMCINKEDVDFTISVLDEAIKNTINKK